MQQEWGEGRIESGRGREHWIREIIESERKQRSQERLMHAGLLTSYLKPLFDMTVIKRITVLNQERRVY